ncbi:MAG: phage holin family protein [Ruminococcus sp.]|nr:phage holin family protein [Ruminococcus sp.]
MDKQTTIQAVITAALAALTYYFSILTVPIIVLMAVMVIDYITGMVSAWHNAELSSKKGVFGIIKKLCYLALVCVGMGVDWLIYSGMTQVGITMNYTVFFGILVAIWLIINELISILENLNRIGVPLPKFITVIVKKLKNTVETEVKESED